MIDAWLIKVCRHVGGQYFLRQICFTKDDLERQVACLQEHGIPVIRVSNVTIAYRLVFTGNGYDRLEKGSIT